MSGDELKSHVECIVAFMKDVGIRSLTVSELTLSLEAKTQLTPPVIDFETIDTQETDQEKLERELREVDERKKLLFYSCG